MKRDNLAVLKEELCVKKFVENDENDVKNWKTKIAERAYRFVEDEIRPYLARGGNLHTKGSMGYPAKLRQLLRPLDKTVPVTHATAAALALDERARTKEHVVPIKRICVEIIDPSKAHPRHNSDLSPIAGGPAKSAAHLLEIYLKLAAKCWVTAEEHSRLNKCRPSSQWDAPGGDGWARYRAANVIAGPIPRSS